MSFHVILHSNPGMISSLTGRLPSFATMHPTPCNKERFTYSIYHGLVECFIFAHQMGISSKYCIVLASNCMLHKEITQDLIENYYSNRVPPKPELPTGHWNTAMRNPELMKTLSSNNINGFHAEMHEGSLIEYDVFQKISDFTIKNKLWEKIDHHTCYEELLLINLYIHFTGYRYPMINIFPTGGNVVPSISQVESSIEPSFKPCPRDVNHPLRVWLRSTYKSLK